MYRALTNEIEITVEPFYLEEQSEPDENRFVWGYRIVIINRSEQTVQLRDRHWRITDAMGQVDEISGEGVVGEQPVLEPGDQFEYSSGCPLDTSSGMMVGQYRMVRQDGESFMVDIPAFSLDVPGTARTLN
ncbi:MAG: Co2+/Mg2+ efflux protein ApaG [Hyphomicrobiales bacterium]|nr:Co2+/Mg2+ efflux protein ApaG [Hyphomicrobiales bacterium]MCP5002202.1 Co2+/Mg2+ efflux protein ApaG [Hyphomicrobiales bacterium]